MACPAGVEPATFSFGGSPGSAELSARSQSAIKLNSGPSNASSLALIVEKIQMILKVVESACYAGATDTFDLANHGEQRSDSKKGGSDE